MIDTDPTANYLITFVISSVAFSYKAGRYEDAATKEGKITRPFHLCYKIYIGMTGDDCDLQALTRDRISRCEPGRFPNSNKMVFILRFFCKVCVLQPGGLECLTGKRTITGKRIKRVLHGF